MSETSPAFHLPTSPLLRSLLDDTNLALSKFFEDQTVHGFLPVPSRRHRRYYRTSSSSFPGPYSIPPGITSITLEKASEVKKRSVSLSASQFPSMETMLSRVCEVASWLDWWRFPGEFACRGSCRLREADSLLNREPWSSWLARASRLSAISSCSDEIPSWRMSALRCRLRKSCA